MNGLVFPVTVVLIFQFILPRTFSVKRRPNVKLGTGENECTLELSYNLILNRRYDRILRLLKGIIPLFYTLFTIQRTLFSNWSSIIC